MSFCFPGTKFPEVTLLSPTEADPGNVLREPWPQNLLKPLNSYTWLWPLSLATAQSSHLDTSPNPWSLTHTHASIKIPVAIPFCTRVNTTGPNPTYPDKHSASAAADSQLQAPLQAQWASWGCSWQESCSCHYHKLQLPETAYQPGLKRLHIPITTSSAKSHSSTTIESAHWYRSLGTEWRSFLMEVSWLKPRRADCVFK